MKTCTKQEGLGIIRRIESCPWWSRASARGWALDWCGGQFTDDAPGWVRVAFWRDDEVAHASGKEGYEVFQALRAICLEVEIASVLGHVFRVTMLPGGA